MLSHYMLFSEAVRGRKLAKLNCAVLARAMTPKCMQKWLGNGPHDHQETRGRREGANSDAARLEQDETLRAAFVILDSNAVHLWAGGANKVITVLTGDTLQLKLFLCRGVCSLGLRQGAWMPCLLSKLCLVSCFDSLERYKLPSYWTRSAKRVNGARITVQEGHLLFRY